MGCVLCLGAIYTQVNTVDTTKRFCTGEAAHWNFCTETKHRAPHEATSSIPMQLLRSTARHFEHERCQFQLKHRRWCWMHVGLKNGSLGQARLVGPGLRSRAEHHPNFELKNCTGARKILVLQCKTGEGSSGGGIENKNSWGQGVDERPLHPMERALT